MKALSLALKTLKECLREPQITVLFMILPAVFVLLYSVAFGGMTRSMGDILKICVVDEGERAADLVAFLRAAEFEGTPAFTVRTEASIADARRLLANREISALVVVPAVNSNAGRSAVEGSDAAMDAVGALDRVIIERDPRSDTAAFTVGMLRGAIGSFGSSASPGAVPSAAASSAGPALAYEFLPNTGTSNDFNASIPGLFVFGIAFGVIVTALLLSRESERGTIVRLRLSPLGTLPFLFGFTLFALAFSGIQALVTAAAALACGFPITGSLLAPFVAILLCSLSCTGFGLIAASFARGDSGALLVGTAFLGPLGFLSGAMYPMSALPLFSIGSVTVGAADLMPTALAVRILSDTLFYGRPAATYDLVLLVAETALVLGLGSRLFVRRRLSSDRGRPRRVSRVPSEEPTCP